MRKIYSCIDVGSHSIKLVVMEKCDDNFVVLSRAITRSKGIKNGKIESIEELKLCIRKAIDMVEKDLKVKINELLCLISCSDAEFKMISGSIDIDGVVKGKDISKVLENAIVNSGEYEQNVVFPVPVSYSIHDRENIKDVLGLETTTLGVKAVLSIVPKVIVRSYIELFHQLDIKLVDIGFGLVGDYYSAKCPSLDNSLTAVVNIGYDSLQVGIFNKGILIKSAKIDTGSKYIDKDIKYVYNLELKKARYLKETFACSNTRYADVDDVVSLEDKDGNHITINQLKISEVIEARITEILKFAKKQISILTKREIHYIIVTGGISELAGFEYVLENVFGRCARVLNMNKMGVRSNSFSSCVGFVEYFDEKLEKLDRAYSMISDTEFDLITKRTRKTSGEGTISGIIGYFTGNKED